MPEVLFPKEDNNTFNYQMLSRLKMDCEYFLGNGGRNEKHLWADSVDEQIQEMKRLWNGFSEEDKPEWLTMQDIEDYAFRMRPKSIWNDTFILEWSYLTNDCAFLGTSVTYIETHRGSLKPILRSILNERRHGHARISISTADGHYLKDIGY
ncbi:LPD11 domain-containing protein [Rhodococcus sp. IEGM1300]